VKRANFVAPRLPAGLAGGDFGNAGRNPAHANIRDATATVQTYPQITKMRFSRVTEFHPAQFHPLLKDWFAGPHD
jgi:hypothetical protein